MSRTFAEQEVTFRWDQEERMLWVGTTTPWVAAKWARLGFPVQVLSHERDGTPCSWEVKLPWTGSKRDWLRVFSGALFPSSRSTLDATNAPAPAADEPRDG